jgi:hypothetical protein
VIWQGTRGGSFGLKSQKPSRGGLVLVSEMQAGLIWARGDPIGAGYTAIEVLGGREGRLIWAKKPKTEPWGLSFGWRNAGETFWG